MTDVEHLARLNGLENRCIKLEKRVAEIEKTLIAVQSTARAARRGSVWHEPIGGH